MDIFKLIYEHDLRLDDLRSRHTDRGHQDITLSIEDFMRPDPTYSRFYITGTRTDPMKFGLDTLDHHDSVIDRLSEVFAGYFFFNGSASHTQLRDILNDSMVWQAILLTKKQKPVTDPETLHLNSESNIGHKKGPLKDALLENELVLYKEKAHHGYDLHLFSRENIYQSLFFPFKELISDQFRFFSINGRRIQTERKFYFETWALERPPHGVEEVFEKTVL